MDPGAGTYRRAVVLFGVIELNDGSFVADILCTGRYMLECMSRRHCSRVGRMSGCRCTRRNSSVRPRSSRSRFETVGDCIRQRGIRQYEQYAQNHEAFHREPRAWQTDRKRLLILPSSIRYKQQSKRTR